MKKASFWGASKRASEPKSEARASATAEVERALEARRSSRPKARAKPEAKPGTEAATRRAVSSERVTKAADERAKDRDKLRVAVGSMFKILDINSNGTIERSELSSVLQKLDRTMWTRDRVNKLMSVIDVSKDGKIDFEELLDWVFQVSDTGAARASVEETRFHQALDTLLSSDHASTAEIDEDEGKGREEAEADKLASDSGRRMISQTHGSFSLHSCRGTYTFDRESGALRLDSKPAVVVGIFSYDPICQRGSLPRHYGGKKEIPCIRICKSEIIKEIQTSSNANAYFVLPSQLNGAEYPSHKSLVTDIYAYNFDHTGGPRGQLAVHPAAGQFVLDNAANETRPDGINAVDEICRRTAECGFALVNGYLQVPRFEKDQEELMRDACKKFRTCLHTLRPLVMRGIPAQGMDQNLEDVCPTIRHKVSLVYASAIPVDAYLNKLGRDLDADTLDLNRRFQAHIAELVLLAQYYGALKTAARERRAKVFLMPLGGGVFNNPAEIIAGSISRAVEMLTKDELARLDIQILTFNRSDEDKTFSDLMDVHRKLIG